MNKKMNNKEGIHMLNENILETKPRARHKELMVRLDQSLAILLFIKKFMVIKFMCL